MDRAKCLQIIEFLQSFHDRPVIFTGKSYESDWTIQYILGFYQALLIIGETPPSFDEIRSAYSNRGWSETYFGAVKEMRASGMDGDAITREIILVEIDLWRAYSARFI